MGDDFLINAVYQLSHNAPVVLFVAAMLDVFLFTGYILYGAAMLSTVVFMHSTGMISTETLLLVAYIGTVSGSIINYLIGRFLGTTNLVQQKLHHPRLVQSRQYLTKRGLLVFMCVGRFITFTRPVYAVLIGSLGISFSRFLIYELSIAFVWVSFWLLIIIKSEELLIQMFH